MTINIMLYMREIVVKLSLMDSSVQKWFPNFLTDFLTF